MIDPPEWHPKLYDGRHHVENLFSRLKDWGRIALRRDKTRRSWMGFAYLAAAMINLRIVEFSHRPKRAVSTIGEGGRCGQLGFWPIGCGPGSLGRRCRQPRPRAMQRRRRLAD